MLRIPVSRVLTPLARGKHHFSLPALPSSTGMWNHLGRIDDQMRDMERSFNRMQRWMDSLLPDFMGDIGWAQKGRRQGQGLLEHELESLQALAVEQPEVVKEGDKPKYRFNIWIGDEFPPENIKVSLKDRQMTIQAKVEQKSDDGKSSFYHEVSRIFTLPKEVDPKEVKTLMGTNGLLQVEAPAPAEALKAIEDAGKPKEIPIQLQ